MPPSLTACFWNNPAPLVYWALCLATLAFLAAFWNLFKEPYSRRLGLALQAIGKAEVLQTEPVLLMRRLQREYVGLCLFTGVFCTTAIAGMFAVLARMAVAIPLQSPSADNVLSIVMMLCLATHPACFVYFGILAAVFARESYKSLFLGLAVIPR